MRAFLDQVGRWPLLLGAVICIGSALWLAEASGDTTAVVAVLLSLGSVLLGAWIHNLATRRPPAEPPDPADRP